MATLDELKSRVLRSLDRVGGGASEEALVETWINQVIREDICSDISWSSMDFSLNFPTVKGQDLYDVPALYAASLGVTDTDLVKDIDMVRFCVGTGYNFITLIEVGQRVEFERFSDIAEGAPQVVARSGDQIRLRPTPDVDGDSENYILQVVGWAYPLPLETGSDSNEITRRNPALVEHAATARGLMYFGEYEKAGFFSQKYEQAYQTAINESKRSKAPANLVMRQSVSAGRPSSPIPGSRSNRGPAYGWFS